MGLVTIVICALYVPALADYRMRKQPALNYRRRARRLRPAGYRPSGYLLALATHAADVKTRTSARIPWNDLPSKKIQPNPTTIHPVSPRRVGTHRRGAPLGLLQKNLPALDQTLSSSPSRPLPPLAGR